MEGILLNDKNEALETILFKEYQLDELWNLLMNSIPLSRLFLVGSGIGSSHRLWD